MKKLVETSPEYFWELKSIVSWKKVLAQLGIKFKPVGKKGDIIARCSFHKEKTPSMRFYSEAGCYKCFGCGRSGDTFNFISLYLFKGNKIQTYYWFKKNHNIPLPWENKK